MSEPSGNPKTPLSTFKATLGKIGKASTPSNPSSSSKRYIVPRVPSSIEPLPTLSPPELDAYCDKIIALVNETDLNQLFDQVRAADVKGHLTEALYAQWIDFFYCFLPMVTKAPTDPVIIDQANLQSHEAILKLFENGVPFDGKGENQVHQW